MVIGRDEKWMMPWFLIARIHILGIQLIIICSRDHDSDKMCLEQHAKFGKESYQKYCLTENIRPPASCTGLKTWLSEWWKVAPQLHCGKKKKRKRKGEK